jgi:hypothetical protein
VSRLYVLNPRRGILVLEVKDWHLDHIQSLDKESVALITPNGLKHVLNPMKQAMSYIHAILNKFEADSLLKVQEGKFLGKLLFPWGYGIVFSNITRKQFLSTDLGAIFEPTRVICKDEMTESVDPEQFQARLWNMFHVEFKRVMTMPEIERIRWHLFPRSG